MSFFAAWPELTWVLLANALLATLLACAAAVAERRGWAKPWVHGLWVVVLLRFLAPPLVPWGVLPQLAPDDLGSAELAVSVAPAIPSPILRSTPSQPPFASEVGPVVSPIPWTGGATETTTEVSIDPTVTAGWLGEYRAFGGPGLLFLLWGAMSALLLGLALRRVSFFVRLARDASDQASSSATAIQLQVDALAKELGLRRAPRVCVVSAPGLASPMILSAWGAPKLLLPKALLEVLREQELKTVLVHELAHLRRRDHWVRWPELLASVLFWWHPVVWWARKSLRRVEEQCVDAWVLRLLPGSRRAYAEALLKTLTLASAAHLKTPALASGIDTMNEMESRLTMILKYRPESTSSEAGVVHRLRWLALPMLVLLLAVLPTWARPGDEAPSQMETEEAHGEMVHDSYDQDPHDAEVEAREIAAERQALEERRRQRESRAQEEKVEAQRQMAMMQRQMAEVEAEARQASEQARAAAAEQKEEMRQEMQRMERHLALQAEHSSHDDLAMEAERLTLEAEAARLEGEQERSEALMARHQEVAKELHRQSVDLVEREVALHQAELGEELERQQAMRQRLVAEGESRGLERIDHHIARLRSEQERVASRKKLRQMQLALEAERQQAEAAFEAAQASAEKALRGADRQRREEAMAALDARQRELEAKHRQLEEQQVQAEVRTRLDEIRSDLPLELEELRLALQEAGDQSELRAELERLHQELGKVLKTQ